MHLAERPGVPNGIRTRWGRQGYQGVRPSFTRRRRGAGALLVAFACVLVACDLAESGPSSWLSPVGDNLRTVQHGPYSCVVLIGPFRGGLWCERRPEAQR